MAPTHLDIAFGLNGTVFWCTGRINVPVRWGHVREIRVTSGGIVADIEEGTGGGRVTIDIDLLHVAESKAMREAIRAFREAIQLLKAKL